MALLDISIIIPTHNRCDLLARTLEVLNHETHPKDRFEAIVVDDGSTDATEDRVKALEGKLSYRITYIKQKNKGPASARNRGIAESHSEIVLFIGDDILPKEDLIERHVSSSLSHPDRATLGWIDWSHAIEVTDFMRFIAPNGFQFRYANIKDENDCGFRHFYTSNISLAKRWFKEDLFDEEFPFASLEDTELAYRLERKGLKVVFDRGAIAYHHHMVSFESFAKRMKLTGISAAILMKKHPELKGILLPVDISLVGFLSRMLRAGALLRHFNKRAYWWSGLVSSYLEGVMDGLRKYSVGHT